MTSIAYMLKATDLNDIEHKSLTRRFKLILEVFSVPVVRTGKKSSISACATRINFTITHQLYILKPSNKIVLNKNAICVPLQFAPTLFILSPMTLQRAAAGAAVSQSALPSELVAVVSASDVGRHAAHGSKGSA